MGGASLVLALAAYFWPSEGRASASGKVNPQDFASARQIAKRWSGVGSPFPNVPPDLVLAIMRAESGYREKSEDHSERAEERGGAYGLMGMTAATAMDLFNRIRTKVGPLSMLPMISSVLKKYATLGTSALLDPNVNALFGTFYLNELGAEFGYNNSDTIAAYHEGASRVRKKEAGPHTRQYVENVTAYRKELEGRA